MNYTDRVLREIANFSPLEVMLADIAVSIQLNPTDYQRAVDHYNAIHEWIEREDSPLFGLVEEFYPQGGFAIGATVARHGTDDEFDIDVMAQLTLRPDVDPEIALSVMDEAIRAEPGSRYHDKADRKTRCSTVYYTGKHLDVTPAVRIIGRDEKTSFIFHSKPEDPRVPKLRLFANPFGLAQWFIGMTPADEAFGLFFEKRSLDYARGRMTLMEKADAAPVPDQMPAYRKSRAVIALQLIKRWRNLAYDRRHKKLRHPPSVLLSYYVAQNANRTRTLSDELLHQVRCIITTLESADRKRETVREFNPMCREDELTDRWPCDCDEQRLFIDELRAFAAQLERLSQGVPLAEMQRILEDLFGERPARESVRKYMDQHVGDDRAGKAVHILRTGSIPALGSLAVPAAALPTPRSTPFGD